MKLKHYKILILALCGLFIAGLIACNANETHYTNDTQNDRWERAGLKCEHAFIEITRASNGNVRKFEIKPGRYQIEQTADSLIFTPVGLDTPGDMYFKPCFTYKTTIE